MKYDATMSMGFVLLNINSEEGTPATKIAPLMGLEARSLTRLLKSMEEKKLIYREADKNDKRSAIVFSDLCRSPSFIRNDETVNPASTRLS